MSALSRGAHARAGPAGVHTRADTTVHARGTQRQQAAGEDPRVGAVVAICPARPRQVAARLGANWPLALSREPPPVADGVPWRATFALAGRTPPPVHLRIALGGGHQSLQHDPAVRADTVAFLAAHLDAGQLATARVAN